MFIFLLICFLLYLWIFWKPNGHVNKWLKTEAKGLYITRVYIEENDYVHSGDAAFIGLTKEGVEAEVTFPVNGIVMEIYVTAGTIYDGDSYVKLRSLDEDKAQRYYDAKITNRKGNPKYIIY